jgi:hypothetical protein
MAALKKRVHELDSLRGLLLVLMTVTHLPTRLRFYSHDFFGFVSAAEGFVFLSAFLTTFRLAPDQPAISVRATLLQRAARLYGYHILLVGLALTAVLVFPHRPALRNFVLFFLDEPQVAVPALLTLAYCPPLFDILPMYVVFLAATPFALRLAERFGYRTLIAGSVLLWLAGQLGARPLLQGAVSAALGGIPGESFGAFSLLAWQLLWVLGLSLGRSMQACAWVARPLPPGFVAFAIAASLCFFSLRLLVLSGFELRPDTLFNKWQLGAARLLNLACLIVVFVHVVRHLVPAQSMRALSLLGRASLPVFCAHIVLSLAAHTVVRDLEIARALHEELLLLACAFSALFVLAWQRDAAKAGRLQQRTA